MEELIENRPDEPQEGQPAPKPKPARSRSGSHKPKLEPRVDLGELARMMRMMVDVDQTSVEDLSRRAREDGLAFVTREGKVDFVVQSPVQYSRG